MAPGLRCSHWPYGGKYGGDTAGVFLDCAEDEIISANRIMVVRMDFTRMRGLFSIDMLPMVKKYFICEFIQNNISAVGPREIVLI
jgi:hypothetical protein